VTEQLIDIDIYGIPANEKKSEPENLHIDPGYLFMQKMAQYKSISLSAWSTAYWHLQTRPRWKVLLSSILLKRRRHLPAKLIAIN